MAIAVGEASEIHQSLGSFKVEAGCEAHWVMRAIRESDALLLHLGHLLRTFLNGRNGLGSLLLGLSYGPTQHCVRRLGLKEKKEGKKKRE